MDALFVGVWFPVMHEGRNGGFGGKFAFDELWEMKKVKTEEMRVGEELTGEADRLRCSPNRDVGQDADVLVDRCFNVPFDDSIVLTLR